LKGRKSVVRVSVVRCTAYDETVLDRALDVSLDLIGGLESFVSAGQTVLLKPNLLEARDGESGATTDKRVVGLLAEKVLALGGKAVVGDSPGLRYRGAGETVLRETGTRAYCESRGAEVVSFDNTEIVETRIPDAAILKHVYLAAAALEADVLVTVPKLKTHSLTVMTGAVKNLYGVLPGGQKTLGHVLGETKETFADLLLDLYALLKPKLAVMDAVTGMTRSWRTGTDRIEPGLLLASADSVALDAAACMLAGISPFDVPMLRRAHERGLGVADPAEIEIVGDGAGARIEGFAAPARSLVAWPFLRLFASAIKKEDPRVSPELCDRCGNCLKACPSNAVRMTDSGAWIELDACIRCFCCHELCPRRAVEIDRGWLGQRLFGAR